MKLKRTVAAVMSAAMIAGSAGGVLPQMNGICVVSEAASKLPAPEITSTSSTTNSVSLKWDAVDGAKGYVVYVHDLVTKELVEYKKVTTGKATIKGLKSGVLYRFRVAAFTKVKGNNVVHNKTDLIKFTTKTLAAPANVTAKASGTDITLSWSKVNGADKYRVYKYDKTSKTFKIFDETAETSYKFSGLTAGETYKFKVSALVDSGKVLVNQTISEPVSATLVKKDVKLDIKDFFVTDETGKKHWLSSFAGKPIIVYFWTRGDVETDIDLNNYDDLYKEYGDRVEFIIVNCEHRSLINFVKEYIADRKLSYQMYYDWDLDALTARGSFLVPQFLAINANGRTIKSHTGYLSKGTVREYIEKILG